MDLGSKMGDIARLAERIKAKEPPAFTTHHKQAAITMAELEKTLFELVMEDMSLKLIFLSLFYFWLMLEAPLRGVSEKKVNRWSMSIGEAVKSIVGVIKKTIDSLPEHKPTLDMKKLGENINDLKADISDEEFDYPLPLLPDELTQQSTNINTRIHTVTSNLLRQSFHPEIIANVLFGYWLRVSTIHAGISEEYYQKMEFYFTEAIDAARQQVPILFQ